MISILFRCVAIDLNGELKSVKDITKRYDGSFFLINTHEEIKNKVLG